MRQAPEIYRDPAKDTAVVVLAPGLTLTVPMTFFAKFGTLQMDVAEITPVLEELYSLITLGPLTGTGITLKEAMEFNGDR